MNDEARVKRVECPWCYKPIRVNASGRLVAHIAITDRCCGSGASLEEEGFKRLAEHFKRA